VSEAILAGETATSILYGQKAAHINLALAYQKKGDFARSIQSFETALKVSLNPNPDPNLTVWTKSSSYYLSLSLANKGDSTIRS
jgi:tetratricopeptide (TPR) repeat protein